MAFVQVQDKPRVTHWYHDRLNTGLPGIRCGVCLDPIDLTKDAYSNERRLATCVLPAPGEFDPMHYITPGDAKCRRCGRQILITDRVSANRADATCWPADEHPDAARSEATEESLDPALAIGVWWHVKANEEVSRTVPKAVEYGAYDLQLIGAVLGHMLGITSDRMSDGPNEQLRLTDAVAQELGTAFYLLGKVARMMSAYQEGRLPSDDTIFDIGIYVRMLQRIREAGSWPGV